MTNRKILENIEDSGKYYNGELRNGAGGTYWMGENYVYEFETSDPDLSSEDLTDAQIDEIFENAQEI